jgi:hypothetical protein
VGGTRPPRLSPGGGNGKGGVPTSLLPQAVRAWRRWQARLSVCSLYHFSLHYDHQPICRSARAASRSLAAPPTPLPCFYPHSQWAAIGPVHVGVRSQAQVHHHGDGPGLLGAAILPAISEGSKRLTQSPEQGGGCLCLAKLLEVYWPPRHQIMLALLPHLASRLRIALNGSAWVGLLLALARLTQPPPLPLSVRHGVTAHKLLR